MNVQCAVGWDIHRKFSQLSLVERNDCGEIRVVKRMRLEHVDRPAMRAELAKLEPGTPVAMEGAFGWPWIADLLDELGLDPHLGHPPAIKVLAHLVSHDPDNHFVASDLVKTFFGEANTGLALHILARDVSKELVDVRNDDAPAESSNLNADNAEDHEASGSRSRSRRVHERSEMHFHYRPIMRRQSRPNHF